MTNKLLRIIRICVSVVIFAILTMSLVSAGQLFPDAGRWLERVQFVPAVMTFTLVIFIGWLIATLLFGRVYCSSVCPLGTVQDIAARSVRLGRHNPRRDYHYSRPLNQVRYPTLVVILVCLMGGYFVIPSLVDPDAMWSRMCYDCLRPVCRWMGFDIDMPLGGFWSDPVVRLGAASVGGAVVAIIIVGIVSWLAARNGRTYCNTLCPVGTTLGLISRFSVFQVEIDTDKCIQCRRCEHVCKASCIDLIDHVVDGSRCVVCFDCINSCPNDAIHYTPRRKQLSIPMMQKITGIAPSAPEATLEHSKNESNPQ